MGRHLFGLMLESIYSIAGNKAPQELENGNTVFLSYREQKICNCLFFSALQYGVFAWNEQSERQGILNSDKNRPPGYYRLSRYSLVLYSFLLGVVLVVFPNS